MNMHAIRIHAFGGPEVVQDDTLPIPEPKSDEILVRIHAASVNPVDAKIRKGGYRRNMRHSHRDIFNRLTVAFSLLRLSAAGDLRRSLTVVLTKLRLKPRYSANGSAPPDGTRSNGQSILKIVPVPLELDMVIVPPS